MSDVFGACIKQRHLGQDAASADWLVGEGIFLPGVNGQALRSMSDPGTAYDDPQIGKDPQVGSMADFVETTDDNGGVHINSGIPNRAFVLAARAIGGESWSGAGRIWYAALTSGLAGRQRLRHLRRGHRRGGRGARRRRGGRLGDRRGRRRGGDRARLPPPAARPGRRGGPHAAASPGSPRRAPSTSTRPTRARPPYAASCSASTSAPSGGGEPQPDRFVYRFRYLSTQTQVHEQELTADLRELARIVLGE